MVKKFSIPVDFNGQRSSFFIFVGAPKEGNHPLYNQAAWLGKERGGSVPGEVMDSMQKLQELSNQNNVSFEDLCVYALGTAAQESVEASEAADIKKSNKAKQGDEEN